VDGRDEPGHDGEAAAYWILAFAGYDDHLQSTPYALFCSAFLSIFSLRRAITVQ